MEKEILKQIKKDKKNGFTLLYNQYADYALRTAFSIMKDREKSSDAVQETFIRVYKNIDSYDPTKPFKPWFYRILLNECNRILRKEKQNISFDQLQPILDSLNEDPNDDEYSELYDVIQNLDDINRIPIILKYIHDFSEKEIAETLDQNVNTIKSRLYKGRQKLREALPNFLKGGFANE